MWWIEAIGISATVFILIAMSVDTSSWKGDVFMRAVNLVGSAIFVVYGAILPAISTAVLNGCLVIVNTYYLIKLIKQKDKLTEQSNKKDEEKVEKTEEENNTKN